MIPFFKPNLGEEEKKAIIDVIDSGWIVTGKKTEEFEEKFAEYIGSKYAVFVDSGTSALFLAIKAWGYKNQEIAVPSLTFTSTAEVIVNSGNIPKFVDIEKSNFCMNGYHNPSIPVHFSGNRSRSFATIYDSAHRIEKNDLGIREHQKFDDSLWCYSFYITKNMTTIEGGAIVLNDQSKYQWLKKARNHGLSKETYQRYNEKLPYYLVDFIGWRMKSDDIRAVIGLEQLKKLPGMTQRRNEIVRRYNFNLGLNRIGNHIYPILVKNREEFFIKMNEAGIQCSIHFMPLHKMPAYQKYYNGENLENTDYLEEKLVSIPLFPTIKNEDIDYISDKILETKLLIKE